MRKFNVVLTALAFGAFGSAMAVDVGATNNGTDALTATGGLSVTLGNADFRSGAAQSAGSTTLSYDTQDQTITENRSIAVRLNLDSITQLPSGVTVTLTPTVTNGGTAASAYVLSSATSAVALTTNRVMVSAIPQFTTAGAASVAYTVAATKGFNDFSGTLTYTLGTAF